jgi:hypothetical protein
MFLIKCEKLFKNFITYDFQYFTYPSFPASLYPLKHVNVKFPNNSQQLP